jgi:hypothetical protein
MEEKLVSQQGLGSKVRVLRIIARMNVGGPAVQVSGLMRGFDQDLFEHELLTGYCAADEADYLEKVATDVKAIRIDGLGRSIKPRADLTALFKIIRKYVDSSLMLFTLTLRRLESSDELRLCLAAGNQSGSILFTATSYMDILDLEKRSL